MTTTIAIPARRPAAEAADERIWQKLFIRLLDSPYAEQAPELAFSVRQGMVTVEGEVAHRHDIPRLLALAWSVPGVARVRDRLTWYGASPEELRARRCSQPDQSHHRACS